MSSCKPLIYLTICDESVHIADSSAPARLDVYKRGALDCSHTLTPSNNKLYLTPTILDLIADTYWTLELRLSDSNNQAILFTYKDCDGESQTSEFIQVKFMECGEPNTILIQSCV